MEASRFEQDTLLDNTSNDVLAWCGEPTSIRRSLRLNLGRLPWRYRKQLLNTARRIPNTTPCKAG
eukprot:2850810-Alexandrium_andersonii.AAC.1